MLDVTAGTWSIPFDSTSKSVNIKATVVDSMGRALTTEQTIAVRCAKSIDNAPPTW